MLRLKTHRKIKGFEVFGQCADRDVIYAGLGTLFKIIQRDITGVLQRGTPGVNLYRLTHHLQTKVIEHYDVGTGADRLFQFGQGFGFHFHRFAGIKLFRCANRLTDPATSNNVVFFNEVSIKHADTVVITAAASHGVFQCAAQAGNGFAGIEQTTLGAFELLHITRRNRGTARKGLNKVHRVALTGEQNTRRPS
ncbi:hypothetical protein DN30_3600 [Vibrio cholerae]|nr:hypothetical protein DN30_3600 [Vibrio cholerae]